MTSRFEFGGEIVWRPTREQAAGSRLQAFIDRHELRDYEDLLHRSVSDPEWFWPAVLDDVGIEFYEPYTRILDVTDGMAWARWCVGGRLNIVHNCLDKWIGTPTEHRIALRAEDENGGVRTATYRELWRDVNRCANGLRQLGIRKGDRVALFMPMCPEVMIALFAVMKIGAITLPLFSGYGADAVAERLRESEAAALVTADGFVRRGQRVAMKAIADQAADRTPTLRHVIVVSRLGDAVAWRPRDRPWDALVGEQSDTALTEPTEAEHPLMIIFTSGTTGRPKGAVHTHCGFPVKSAQDMAHAFDVHASDRMCWVTDMGWIMGPWLGIGMTLLAGTMVLYEGAPDYPAADRMWALVDRHRVSILGLSPTLVRSLMRHGEDPVRRHDLSSLRLLGSTGEPWNPEPWRWLFQTVGGSRLPIINYSGGTECGGGLVAGNVLTPIKPASFAGPLPGIAADVVDDDGRSVVNQVGELVVRAPWIGMTRGFWRDPARYVQTYWNRFPDVWVQGDWSAVDDDGVWYILGRSDDTIKIAGKRVGPAEVESVLVEHPAILEAAAIGVPNQLKGQALVCFCVVRPGHAPTTDLADDLKARVANRLGKPLRPEAVAFVTDLPKTRNAKLMRRVIRATYLGEPPGDLSSLENPQAVAAIAQIRS
jgi:acetyl-CoA synthetase